jgi:hypothetical protein
MNNDNLWGNITDEVTEPAPILLLREQASKLTELTKGQLIGIANASPVSNSQELACHLSIRVPALSNYEVTLVSFRQPVAIYPFQLYDRISNKKFDCTNYDSFKAALQGILSNEQTRKVISGLWLQARKP